MIGWSNGICVGTGLTTNFEGGIAEFVDEEIKKGTSFQQKNQTTTPSLEGAEKSGEMGNTTGIKMVFLT
jgi:hypothetical protein